jgi:hypothetical protein
MDTTAMISPTITPTGLQPTGELHLGNYAGAITRLAQLAVQPRETYMFVADLLALNSRPDPDRLRDRTRKMPPRCWRAASTMTECTCAGSRACPPSRK